MKFAQPNRVPEFAPREFLAGKDAATLARDVLSLTQEEFSAAFRGSPMKRAKLPGLKRNAAGVLGNSGDAVSIPALVTALSDTDPIVRAHAARALGGIGSPEALLALRAREPVQSASGVLSEIKSALSSTSSR